MLCEFCHKNLAVVNYRTFAVCETCKQRDIELTIKSESTSEFRVKLLKEFQELNMNPSEELFAKYYNRGKLLVAEMDDTALREHREQLREIATEAKATLMAADDEIRERSARKSSKQKEWLVSVDTDGASTDAINAVKTRAARLSKMDKLAEQLKKAGIDDATIKEMVRGLERTATEKALKTVTFQKPTTETVAVQVKKQPESNNEPFDPSKLTFGK